MSLLKKHSAPVAVGAVMFWTLFHLLMASRTELIPEEAYYWTYSQHPALSYFDHPPMVAWLIGLGTSVFGDTELGVRILAILLWPVSALLLFLTGRLWFGSPVAGLSVLFFCLSPILVGIGFIVTPDVPLVFFWLLTLYGISKALHTGLSRFWYIAGIGLGCALLSKYTAIMLPASLLLFLLLSDEHRPWLKRSEPWLALLLAISIFSPVILWNAQHQWASFLFQSTRTAGVRHAPLHEVGMFWSYQLLALTPFLFVLFFYSLIPAVRRGFLLRQDRWNFCMAFALPLFSVFVLASFKNKGHINWTAPAFLTWSIAAAALFLKLEQTWLNKRARIWRYLVAFGIALPVAMTLALHISLAYGIPHVLKFSNAGGWRELSVRLGQARDELSNETGKPAFIVGSDKLNVSAETGFYLRNTTDTINNYALGATGIGYRYWMDLNTLQGRPALVVLQRLDQYPIPFLKQYFAEVGEPELLSIGGDGPLSRSVYLVKCQGYFTPHP